MKRLGFTWINYAGRGPPVLRTDGGRLNARRAVGILGEMPSEANTPVMVGIPTG